MAWFEFHSTTVKRLQKFIAFRRQAGISTVEALGILASFWGEVLDIREDGDITGWTAEYFADLVGVKESQAERVFTALIHHGWIDRYSDGTMLVHDWLDTAGRYLTRKLETNRPERLKEIKEKHRKYNEMNKVHYSDTMVTQHNTTEHNKQNITEQDIHNIVLQIENLRSSFSEPILKQIDVFIERMRVRNKSGVITEGRKRTVLMELFNSKQRCNNDTLFSKALDAAISYDAPNINYVNAVIKGEKTKKPR